MPELPEVETVVRSLRPCLLGQRVMRIRHLRADMVTPADFDLADHLTDRTVVSITRRGKRIIFALDSGESLFIHLGMSGRLTIEPSDAPVLPHTHFIATIASGAQLRFRDPRRFGEIRWLGRDGDAANHGNIGPEPFGLRTATLAQCLARTTRAIKNALLDQTVIAGLGNIYVDESLFAARIHPLSRANELTAAEVATLNRAIKSTLRRAIRHRGSTLRDYVDADGNAGQFKRLHRVYAREGERCRTCKTPIRRMVLGGRSTHFCPKCQRRSTSLRDS